MQSNWEHKESKICIGLPLADEGRTRARPPAAALTTCIPSPHHHHLNLAGCASPALYATRSLYLVGPVCVLCPRTGVPILGPRAGATRVHPVSQVEVQPWPKGLYTCRTPWAGFSFERPFLPPYTQPPIFSSINLAAIGQPPCTYFLPDFLCLGWFGEPLWKSCSLRLKLMATREGPKTT